MCEEFTHALIISIHLKVHVHLEILDIEVTIRSLQQHPQRIDAAEVTLAHIDHYAWVLPLLQGNFSIFVLWFQN